MAAPVLPLVDRADIHKSCKSLESVVNVFNSYCQAVDTLASTQKKLAKSLRDAAGIKGVTEVAANAMGAAATLFETLADVDFKFVKIADRECESASSELKKWFKRLAKEEKLHDEKLAAANLKVKQAGQAYEKKSKRRDVDSVEEHARYVQILSMVGPELSQQNHQHAMFVTQRHTHALFSVASSIARVADAEWSRSCECVRRFSPTIGQVGEYRAYLEGAWAGPIPKDLPEDSLDPSITQDVVAPTSEVIPNTAEVPAAPRTSSPLPIPSLTQHSNPSESNPAAIRPPEYPTAPQSRQPPSSYVPVQEQKYDQSVRSITTLSSFPVPPSHFPIPAVSSTETPEADSAQEIKPPSPVSTRLNNGRSVSGSGRGSETTDTAPDNDREVIRETEGDQQSPGQRASESQRAMRPLSPPYSPRLRVKNPLDSSPNLPLTNSPEGKESADKRLADRNGLGRGSGSLVASMKDRLEKATEVSSPNRAIPQLPTSVSNLASRYTPIDTQDSGERERENPRASRQYSTKQGHGPRRSITGVDPSSSSHDLTPPVPSSPVRQRTLSTSPVQRTNPAPMNGSGTSTIDANKGEQSRLREMDEARFQERERQLRELQHQLNLQASELERERAEVTAARVKRSVDHLPLQSNHPSHISTQSPLLTPEPSRSPQGYHPRPGLSPRPYMQHASSSTSNLISSSYSYSHSQTTLDEASSSAPHSDICGCQECSIRHYRAKPAPVPESPTRSNNLRPQKSKGWMRRLSMPVMDALTSDSKKNAASPTSMGQSLNIPGGGKSSRNSSYFQPSEDGFIRASLEHDASGGISNIRSRKISFGRR